MEMMNKEDRMFEELIVYGKLLNYKDILRKIVDLIKSSGFTVSTRYDSIQSVTNWGQKNIQVSLIKKPLEIIWDLFHEYGHVLSGEKVVKLNEYDHDREILAWKHAFVEMLRFEDLAKLSEDFEKYKQNCLKVGEQRIKNK